MRNGNDNRDNDNDVVDYNSLLPRMPAEWRRCNILPPSLCIARCVRVRVGWSVRDDDDIFYYNDYPHTKAW